MNNSKFAFSPILDWHLPSEKPSPGTYVIIESIDGTFTQDYIYPNELFAWCEDVIRWAYCPLGGDQTLVDAKLKR